jgi:O-antigen biosynthesis protein
MEGHPPGISVIVPVYNAERALEACVRSMLELDYPPQGHELIFVDNGSTDGSNRILESFGGRIRVLREPKRGASAARNHGVRNARFPVVAFTDSDCVVDPQWLRYLARPLSDREVGVSGGSILARRPCNRIEAFGETVHDNSKAVTYQPPYCASGNWASRKEDLLELGGFDETFLRSQDCELSCRMYQAGFKFVHVPEAVVYHKNERTYAGLFKEGFTHGKNNVALIERHRKFYESAGYDARNLNPYRRLWSEFRAYLSGTGHDMTDCSLVFNTGKRLGRLAGSVRSGALHL